MNSMRSITLFFVLLLAGCAPAQKPEGNKTVYFRMGDVVVHKSNPAQRMVIEYDFGNKYSTAFRCNWIADGLGVEQSAWYYYYELEPYVEK